MNEIDRLNQGKKQLDQVSPSFCMAKWKQVTLHLFNGNTQSCHHVRSHRVPLEELRRSPAALHNTLQKKKSRQQMRDGIRPSECQYCWNIEDVGEISDRVYKSTSGWSWPYLEDIKNQSPNDDTDPSYVEVAFDNICNLKCAYCSPVYSSSWEAEIKKYGPYPTSLLFNNLDQFKIQKSEPLPLEGRALYEKAFWDWWPRLGRSLHHLRVTGGEPLMTAGTWRLLEELVNEPRPDLILSINSNLTLPKDVILRFVKKLGDVRSQVAKIVVFCSIDTVGKQAEYIRYGLKEERFWQNVELILEKSAPGFSLSFMITVNALSLPGLSKLVERISDLRNRFPQHNIGVDTPYLHHPEHLNVRVLDKEHLIFLDRTLELMNKRGFLDYEIQRVERIRELMQHEPFGCFKLVRLRADLSLYLKEYDRRRNLNHKETFPEFDVLLYKCHVCAILMRMIYSVTTSRPGVLSVLENVFNKSRNLKQNLLTHLGVQSHDASPIAEGDLVGLMKSKMRRCFHLSWAYLLICKGRLKIILMKPIFFVEYQIQDYKKSQRSTDISLVQFIWLKISKFGKRQS